MSDGATDRSFLLEALAEFMRAAANVQGVARVAVVGSLVTDKPSPKDADVLVTVRDDADIRSLPRLGRKLKGVAQSRNLGADIFLASTSGAYVGRTCSYRECHPRSACRGTQCGSGRWICSDLEIVRLPDSLVAEPPLEIWPQVVVRTVLPADTQRILLGG
jgi:predicted nucleotidyltransferase